MRYFELLRESATKLAEARKMSLIHRYCAPLDRPDTWLYALDPEIYNPLVWRCEGFVMEGSYLKRDVRALKIIWKECFRSQLIHSPKMRGRLAIEVDVRAVELIQLLTSSIGAIYLTSEIESSAVRSIIDRAFYEESTDNDKVYGLPFTGPRDVLFLRKCLRVVTRLIGLTESMVPIVTGATPAEAKVTNWVDVLDGLFSRLDGPFKEVTENLALGLLRLCRDYGLALRLKDIPDGEVLVF